MYGYDELLTFIMNLKEVQVLYEDGKWWKWLQNVI
jgi:hypothetical protein